MSMEENKDPLDEQEQFSFMQETIKEEPIDKKKEAWKLGKIALYGAVFGVMVCVGFFALKPWAETAFQKKPGKVTIPEDEKAEADSTEGEEDAPTEEIPKLSVESYEHMQDALYEIAKEAEKSIVEVKAVRGNEAWITETYDTIQSSAGLIFAENNQEILILADYAPLAESEGLSVVFGDNTAYTGTLVVTDETLGFSVVSVQKSELKASTNNYWKVATLGNSYSFGRGNMVLALGKPFGYMGGIGYGTVSAAQYDMEVPDGSYDLLLTDMAGSEKGNGVLFNTKGEVMGIIKSKITEGDSARMVNAFGISGLKQNMNLMANGEQVPYIGILGTEVTEAIEIEQGIPRGVYVREAAADSPAMKSGILNGDIIIKVGKEKVTSMASYQNAVAECKVGEDVPVEVMRRGNNGYVEMTFTVTAGNR